MSQTTICHKVLAMTERPADAIAILTKENKKDIYVPYSWKEYYQEIMTVAGALKLEGVKAGDHIAIFSNTRWEWSICDYAIMSLGATTIPIYHSITHEDLQWILNNSEATHLFVENRNLLKMVLEVQEKCPDLKKIICFEQVRQADTQSVSLKSFKDSFSTLSKSQKVDIEASITAQIQKIRLQDTATILYTSGTTGLPKGVVLTHEQIISEVGEAFATAGVSTKDVSLSFLPYSHVLGRIEHWGHMYHGFTLAYAESIEKIRQNLGEVKPTILIAVPRIFEKVYTAIIAQIDSNPVLSRVFKKALEFANYLIDQHENGHTPPIALLLAHEALKKTIFKKIRNAFGGRLRFAISGGAPLSKEVGRFFYACDVLLLEGYGLTETTAAVCVNRPYDFKFGTIGKPIGDVELKIAADGELLVKSKKVMKEYYKNPQATAETLVDGWLHTGDIAEIDSAGYVKITDRKKDLLKTAGGKYVAPQKLESLLKLYPFVSQALIFGDQKKYVVAVLTLNKEYVQKMAKEMNVSFAKEDDMPDLPFVKELSRKAIAEVNSKLASYETIKRFAILPRDLTVEAGEMTASLKPKRKVVYEKYKSLIESLYN